MENLEIWDKVSRPPAEALKPIVAGRLRGKTDINPVWRYKAMTDVFGPIGFGWTYQVDRLWTEQANAGQVMAFAQVTMSVKQGNDWSKPIPGVGGSMLIELETKGLYASDEGFKMAITDALSVCMKTLGVAADIYMNLWDGSKYKDHERKAPGQPPSEAPKKLTRREKAIAAINAAKADGKITPDQFTELSKELTHAGTTDALLDAVSAKFGEFIKVNREAAAQSLEGATAAFEGQGFEVEK